MQHGNIACDPATCQITGQDGVAALTFIPKQEANPGFGVMDGDSGTVGAFAIAASRAAVRLGTASERVSIGAAINWQVTFHNPAGAWTGTITFEEAGSQVLPWQNAIGSETHTITHREVAVITSVDYADNTGSAMEAEVTATGSVAGSGSFSKLTPTSCGNPPVTATDILTGSTQISVQGNNRKPNSPVTLFRNPQSGYYLLYFSTNGMQLTGKSSSQLYHKGACNAYTDGASQSSSNSEDSFDAEVFQIPIQWDGQTDRLEGDYDPDNDPTGETPVPLSQRNVDGVPTRVKIHYKLQRTKQQ